MLGALERGRDTVLDELGVAHGQRRDIRRHPQELLALTQDCRTTSCSTGAGTIRRVVRRDLQRRGVPADGAAGQGDTVAEILSREMLAQDGAALANSPCWGRRRRLATVLRHRSRADAVLHGYRRRRRARPVPRNRKRQDRSEGASSADFRPARAEQAYVAPRTPFETELRRSVRGAARPAGRVHDNFFELGGDSIITSLVARANQAGIPLTPASVRRPTIAQIAAHAARILPRPATRTTFHRVRPGRVVGLAGVARDTSSRL